MPDPLRHVNPGQPFRFSARVYNAMVDAAQAQKLHRHDKDFGTAGPLPGGYRIRVKNRTGRALPSHSIVGLDSPIFYPDPDRSPAERAFKNEVAYNVTLPLASKHRGKFAVTIDPMDIGRIGWAYVDGVCQVQITIDPNKPVPPNLCVDVQDENTESLVPMSEGGSAQVIWVEHSPDSGLSWATVRLGTNCRICCHSSSSSSSSTSSHHCPTSECPHCDPLLSPCEITASVTEGLSPPTLGMIPPDCAAACNQVIGSYLLTHTRGCSWVLTQANPNVTLSLFWDGMQWTTEAISTNGTCTVWGYWHSSNFNCHNPLSGWIYDVANSYCVCAPGCGLAMTPD